MVDAMQVETPGANPSADAFEQAKAGFRSVISAEDDSNSYLKPLTEILKAEGDIPSDLHATEEHMKKLKHHYTELLTKKRFMECVKSNAIEESAELSAELDLKIADAKREAKVCARA